MQTVMKDSEEPGVSGLNWRQRQKANPRRQLVNVYARALGGRGSVTALQMVEIERAASLTLLAQDMRAKALRGETIDIGDMVRLEGALSRVLRSLNLPPPGSAAPADDAFAKFLASQHAATTGEDG
jgi:hypothetical protein